MRWRRPREVGFTPVRIALVCGLSLLAIALIAVLSGSPPVVARAVASPSEEALATAPKGGFGACQTGEAIPAGVTAIRLATVSDAGSHVFVLVSAHGHTITTGSVASGWTSGDLTIPVGRTQEPVTSAAVCFAFRRSPGEVQVRGSGSAPGPAPKMLEGRRLHGRFTVEYLRPGSASWWSSIETVARHLGVGHAPSGTWLAVLLVLAMGGAVAAASWIATRELE